MLTNYSFKLLSGLAMAVAICSTVYAQVELPTPSTLQPPVVKVIDRNNVNMVAGALTVNLTDLSIGNGDLSLTHTIANYGGYFWGYAESYFGSVGIDYLDLDSTGLSKMTIMRVISGHTSTEFKIVDGQYVGLKDPQSTLVRSGNTYIFIDPEGTEYTYRTKESAAHARAYDIEKIKYPNGYTLTLQRKLGENAYQNVSSNTGLQFKYIFANSSQWARTYPQFIYAVNNAVEYCSPTAASCSFENEWPKVTYEWPTHMPESINNWATVFKVIDAGGRVNEYHHSTFGYGGGRKATRIVRIKSATTDGGETTAQYYYANKLGYRQIGMLGTTEVVEPAVLTHVVVNGQSWSYGVDNLSCADYGCAERNKTSNGYDVIDWVKVHAIRGVPTYVKTADREVFLSSNYDNRVSSVNFPEGNRDGFQYDSRGRLIKKTSYPRLGSGLSPITIEARYPEGCPNRKTCNKPIWVTDGKGNRTDYTYHGESGQVATITLPPDENGIRPQTRYTYQQKYAWYKNASGSFQRADSPIWLLVKESTCRTSAATTNGCSKANDEVVTTYDYGPDRGPNNLFLRGIAVTADGETRRTCYSYDIYGNRIGETLPKAGLSSCP